MEGPGPSSTLPARVSRRRVIGRDRRKGLCRETGVVGAFSPGSFGEPAVEPTKDLGVCGALDCVPNGPSPHFPAADPEAGPGSSGKTHTPVLTLGVAEVETTYRFTLFPPPRGPPDPFHQRLGSLNLWTGVVVGRCLVKLELGSFKLCVCVYVKLLYNVLVSTINIYIYIYSLRLERPPTLDFGLSFSKIINVRGF